MEIPKSLQEEIQSVQNKLKNAIQNHQAYVGKLNDDPNNEDLLSQIGEIQEHIISLSKCQKQVVQRLRKEVKLYEAANSNGIKVSIASLLGLNNNNTITNNNETKTSRSQHNVNGQNLNCLSRRSSKDDYEDEIQNVDPPSPVADNNCRDHCAKARPRSEGTDSTDEDVVEISLQENCIEKSNSGHVYEIHLFDQLDFLGSLGLITSDKHTELQNKRAERKRRSTANPQFVYSNWEIPTKRKRYAYLQSSGTAPQTRQTTARLNGPSPPPPPNKNAGSKALPLPSRTHAKSLIPTQKSTTRPNILRNNPESKVFSAKVKSENGSALHTQPTPAVKSVQSIGSKAVHIPGLPASLTIERIDNDSSAVCIHCRNPGSLTMCEICTANFHVSCHATAPAPLRICPKCIGKSRERDRDGDSASILAAECKEEDEIATTSNASRVVGKTGEDAKIYKTPCGFHKVDAAEERHGVSTAIGIDQLPSSTFLIPINPNTVLPSSVPTVNTADNILASSASSSRESSVNTPYSSVLINQLSQPSNIQPDTQVSYAYQVPVSGGQQEKSQSYLILKKIPDSTGSTGWSKHLPPPLVARSQFEKRGSSSVCDYQQSPSTGYNDDDQSEIQSIAAASIPDNTQSVARQFLGKLRYNGQGHDATESTTSKPFSGTPKLFNGDMCLGNSHAKLNINQLRPARQSNSFIPLHSIINEAEAVNQSDVSTQSETRKVKQQLPLASGAKGKSKGNLLYSLFSSNNEPHPFPGCFIQSQHPGPEQMQPKFNQPCQDRETNRDEPEPRHNSPSSRDIPAHVKLEEAHLPAPLRTNLVRKSIEENLVKIPDPAGRADKSDTLSKTEHPNNDLAESKNQRSDTSEVKNNLKSDVASLQNDEHENLKATLDFIDIERKHSSTYIKFNDFTECGQMRDKQANKVYGRQTGKQDPKVFLHTSIRCDSSSNNFIAPRNEQHSTSEIKAEFERQDLPVNEHEPLRTDGVGSEAASFLDKGSSTLSQLESKAKLGINAVSTENMQVLEQFESAMLEVGEDETANC